MKKIVLVNPPLSSRQQGSLLSAAIGRTVPYGLLSVAAAIRQAGYEVMVVDAANSDYGIQEAADVIMALRPDYIGISAVTVSVKNAGMLADEIKKRKKDTLIMLGGMHISAIPERTLREFPGIDIGVVGEGEETVVELLRTLKNNACLGTVKGIVFRSGSGVVKTDARPFICELDSIPLPAWDLLTDRRTFYRLSATSHIRLPAAPIVTSRGCTANCIFCSCKAMFGELRCFSVRYVIRMIKQLINEYGIKDISIYDDNFISRKERVYEFCETIRDEKLRFSWSCYSRVDHGDEKLFRMMKKCGCWQISYGIESGSQRILDFIGKGITVDQIVKTVDLTKDAGLRARGFFMLGHLSEDRLSIKETLRLLLKLKLDDFHIAYYNPFPGTTTALLAERYGTVDHSWEKMNMHNPSFIPYGLTVKELEFYSKYAYRRFYFRYRIICGYLWIIFRYPENILRVVKGFKAVICKISLREA
ncbi:MAG: radical SAM protein [Candidatus Omnitrophota bacterium]|jgi:radical SAM superfamily enzyme YgiQ (UPF0313 family)